MKLRHPQAILISLFVVALLVHLGCFAWAFRLKAIYVEDLQTLTVHILTVYSVPLGVIIGGVFGGSANPSRPARSTTFWTATALSLLWNLLLASRSLLFAFAGEDSVASLLDYVEAVASASTFLIGGALAYYFAR